MQSQRELALRRANAVRTDRAVLRNGIRALSPVEGCAMVADLFRDPTEVFAALPVYAAIQMPRYIGESRARDMLRRAGTSGVRRVRDLSPRQRHELARCMENWALARPIAEGA